MQQINRIEGYRVSKLFKDWKETLIWSYLQGCMGCGWVDDAEEPKSAQIVVGDFCFLAGEPNIEIVRHIPTDYKSEYLIMVPQNETWAKFIEDTYLERSFKITRYAIKKEPEVFNIPKLKSYVESLDTSYVLKAIDQEVYEQVMEEERSQDLCSQFTNYEDYAQRGLGFVVLHEGKVVSGASSYTIYREGIEIEIDTHKDYRRQGLALVCGARLVLECLERGLYPSWDAANKASVALAEKLGYHFAHEYVAYAVKCAGRDELSN
ncbi:GNAT family N-acetyltransferase [Niameybacter massiliensis]|uniref:GNAT family N-acetyltransferase n=1 Tax=Niameybacter massiliensis TaxID=1658108 RepID=UPI0006B5D888|nr:GNAT family N-acetyltransferase [Niameybacter massiliensis]